MNEERRDPEERIKELEAQVEHERALYRHAVELKVKYLERLEAQVAKLKRTVKSLKQQGKQVTRG
jgi:hypothetical protein